jgi:hypothetical protein
MATKKTIITKTQSFLLYGLCFRKEKPKSVYLFAKLNGFQKPNFMTFRHYRKFRKEIFKIF